MIYRTEGEAIRRIWRLMQVFGVWPGYYRTADGWALTYDPPLESRNEHEGVVLL